MNCPACGAPIQLKPETEGLHCDFCHSAFFPGEENDGAELLNDPAASAVPESCPLCSLPLARAAIAKIPVLTCVNCQGLLLPMPVLPPLIEALRQGREQPLLQTPPDHADLKRTVQCPRCHRRMETHFYAGPGNVIVDSCGGCYLVWLDRGELTRIAHAPDTVEMADSNRP